MSQPSGQLSACIQAIWSAWTSNQHRDKTVKPLYSDAGSGLIFNLFGELVIDEESFPEGVILLPVSKKAETITLTPGATLAGVRFHPAIGYGVLGKHWNTPTRLCPKDDNKFALYQTFATLQQQCDALHRIEALYQWAETYLDFTNLLPASLEQALKRLEDGASPGQLNDNVPLSQRQIERQFQLWLEMTPKHYQRILRIKKTIDYLRSYKNANLAEVAQYLGFSDQAHMTREFRDIARTTPGKI